MKSSTRNQFNNPILRSEKRLDVLVKKQETEHQHIIAEHHKEMQALRDELLLVSQKFVALYDKNENELKDFKTYMVCSLGIVKEKLKAQEEGGAEQKVTLKDLHEQLTDFQILYTTTEALDKLAKTMDAKLLEVTKNHLLIWQELQMELKSLLKLIKDDLEKHKCDTEKKFSNLIAAMDMKLNINKIDRDGILKEVRINDKTIFIIEKKIENIYTLIERINKREEVCHKQE